VSWQLLNIVRLLKLTRLRGVWIDEIEEAAEKWTRQQHSNPNIRFYKHTGSYFIYVAKKWLRFAGVLKLLTTPRTRFADKLDDYARWMTEEAGLSMLTVRSR
jgi:DNA-binding transcriptional MerR regulator